MDIHSIVEDCQGFQWDRGNNLKNWLKHGLTQGEAEQAFLNEPLLLLEDKEHSEYEDRFLALGRTDEGRRIFISFTISEKRIRIISARSMNKKERDEYEKFETTA